MCFGFNFFKKKEPQPKRKRKKLEILILPHDPRYLDPKICKNTFFVPKMAHQINPGANRFGGQHGAALNAGPQIGAGYGIPGQNMAMGPQFGQMGQNMRTGGDTNKSALKARKSIAKLQNIVHNDLELRRNLKDKSRTWRNRTSRDTTAINEISNHESTEVTGNSSARTSRGRIRNTRAKMSAVSRFKNGERVTRSRRRMVTSTGEIDRRTTVRPTIHRFATVANDASNTKGRVRILGAFFFRKNF